MATEEFPRVGFGTDLNTELRDFDEFTPDFEEGAGAVEYALSVGYRHIDTAQVYGTEEAVGAGIRRSEVPREDVFLVTKVHQSNLAYEDVLETTEESLDRLGVDYVDLLYVHWPVDAYEPTETLAAFDELREAGKTRHVGVSNFTPELLDEARAILESPIVAHQVEMHPLLQQDELLEYARKYGHYLVAFSPLLRGRVSDVPLLAEIAEKHGATAAQVSLAWLLSKENVAVIPKSSTESHIAENFKAQTFDLDPEDIEAIDGIEREERIIDFEFSPWRD